MKRLYDDPVSPRTLYPTFRVLGLSGQIEGHHFSRRRALKIVDRVAWLFAMWLGGMYVGWLLWGVR